MPAHLRLLIGRGCVIQFFSDSLSERIRYRMRAGFEAGRYLRASPIGYMNAEKALVRDPERAPLVKKAFELVASGSSMAAAMSLTKVLLASPTGFEPVLPP